MAKVRLTDRALRKEAPKLGQLELWDDLVPGFGLRIASKGARTFFVMKRVNGRLVRRTVGRVALDGPPAPGALKLPAARERARGMLEEMQRGVDPAPRRTASDGPPTTFGGVAAAYFADPARRGGARLASRSELERKVRIDLAAWASRPIAEIDKAEIKRLIGRKRQEAPVSANRLLALVKRIMRWAAIEDLIPANPAADIEGTDEVERDRVLTPGELARVWSGADALGYPYGPLIKLLILTAQRRSEVAGLVRAEIDGTSWRLPDARAKRRKGHLVPLSPNAVEVLASCPRFAGSDLIFTTGRRKGGEAQAAPVSGWSRVKDRLDGIIAEKAAEAAGEPLDLERHALPHWTLHDLRRSVATHLRDEGVMGEARADRLTVSKILNHAEGGMTRIYDRYASDPEKRRALDAWAEVVA